LIRLRDWKCTAGHVSASVPYDTAEGRCPEKITCPQPGCRRAAYWTSHKTNDIHANSSLYNRYEIGLGAFVTSYEHKKQLMYELGVEESSDPTGGSRCYQPEEPPPRPANNSQFLDAGDMAAAQAEALSRAAQGDFDLELE